MKPSRLSQTAIERIHEIALWTIDTFGGAQADAYEQRLFDSVDSLAAGHRAGRSCAHLVPGHPTAAALRYLRVERHYLIYLESDDEIVVLDFVHGARDLSALLDVIDDA